VLAEPTSALAAGAEGAVAAALAALPACTKVLIAHRLSTGEELAVERKLKKMRYCFG
jgi:ABC-type bacteriocin/lantibiotic exporter with double-glycine peptidase domain